jgi:L-rhamnose mutarotase|tara:strand:+ start:88 stop:411 length:324 start_codon:yes stop_codon:yes gene_type:complete
MEKIGFRLQVRTEMMDEYIQHHKNVWPEMLEALRETGWHNYSLFLDESDGTLFGYFETPDFAAAKSGMADLEINAKWQELMSPYFVAFEGKKPDEGFIQLSQVFYLA